MKPWYRSKTKWGSLILALGAGLGSPQVAEAVPEIGPFVPLVQAIGIALVGIGARNALDK